MVVRIVSLLSCSLVRQEMAYPHVDTLYGDLTVYYLYRPFYRRNSPIYSCMFIDLVFEGS